MGLPSELKLNLNDILKNMTYEKYEGIVKDINKRFLSYMSSYDCVNKKDYWSGKEYVRLYLKYFKRFETKSGLKTYRNRYDSNSGRSYPSLILGNTEDAPSCEYEEWYYSKIEIEYIARNGKKVKKKVNKGYAGKANKISEFNEVLNIEQGRIFKGRLRQLILHRDEYKCVFCGRDAKDNIKLEIDHIKPWHDGGKTIYGNGRTVCNECNKGLYHMQEFNKKYKEVI